MSLQTFIQGKTEVRQGFGARLLRPQAKLARGLQAPPLATNYEMVAGAFDYLLGFLLERLNPQVEGVYVVTPTKPCVSPARSGHGC